MRTRIRGQGRHSNGAIAAQQLWSAGANLACPTVKTTINPHYVSFPVPGHPELR
jgi:hypothetical protein